MPRPTLKVASEGSSGKAKTSAKVSAKAAKNLSDAPTSYAARAGKVCERCDSERKGVGCEWEFEEGKTGRCWKCEKTKQKCVIGLDNQLVSSKSCPLSYVYR
jgi:N-acetylglucosamine kinase-like BadF-type ATPase